MPTPPNEQVLEEGLARLEADRSWSPRLVSKLEHFIRTGDDYALYYVNPIAFARERGVPEQETIELFLHGVHRGLFQFHWQLMCPCCGDRIRDFRTLKLLEARYFCSFCQVETVASLDDFIEVSFSIAPQVRTVSFHEPDRLPIDDYCFKLRLHPGGRLEGGVSYVDLMKSHLKGLAYVAPGESRRFEFEAVAGSVLGHDFTHGAGLAFTVQGEPEAATQTVEAVLTDGSFGSQPASLRPGPIRVTVANEGQRPLAFALLFFAEEVPCGQLVFEPFLSGKQLLTTKTYHDLFRAEISPGMEGVGVRDITILFTDLKSSTAMYDRIGDLKAYSLVRQHFGYLERAIAQFGGVLVKTIGDAIMAAYARPEDALKSAIEMIREIRSFNASLPAGEEIRLKVGLHRGHSIAVALNDRLDYFGQTVNIAARVQGLADADEIYLTEAVYGCPTVRESLGAIPVTEHEAHLKGVQGPCRVFRIAGS